MCVLSFLLGHASIAHVVSPFSLAFFVVLTELAGWKRSWPAVLAIAGAYWGGGVGGASIIFAEFSLYVLCRRIVFRNRALDIHLIPFIGGLVAVACKLGAVGTVWTRYDIFLSFTEGALVIILALIFIQCIPLFIGKEYSKTLKHEQLISLVIFTGSVIAGLNNASVSGLSLVQLGLDLAVVTMAFVGGLNIGATVAVVVGILAMLNHAQTLSSIAILAFAGLMTGLLKDAGRFWAGLAFIGTISLLTLSTDVTVTALEYRIATAAIAVCLLFLTPKRLFQQLAAYVPGTNEYKSTEQERVRRVRTLLSTKIHEMSQVFEELSATFADTGENPLTSTQQLLTHIVGSAANDVCRGCPRQSKCWDKEGYATYQAIAKSVAKLEAQPTGPVLPAPELKDRCIRVDAMMGVLRHNLEITERDARWIAKMKEQRTLVSSQLSGVANVVRTLAGEIDKGTETSLAGEEQILAGLEQLGLYVDHVHIVSLDPGKVEVEITQPSHGAYENSVRMIAPLLSGIVGENISVSDIPSESPGPCTSVFTSAKLFNVETAVSTAARDGRMVSGDSYTAVDLDNGRYAVALSDGMGNGERARRESKAAIELLKKLLKAGFDEQLAIKTVNSTLLLRSREEMFTTLDMALIDLFSAKAEFLKIGSAPSFIKRGKQVRAITGANVPIGILQDIEVQSIEEQLEAGDILILMSDGIYDAPHELYDKDDWLRRQIERLETNNPQEIADTLLESAVRMANGQMSDDMTVMVATITRHQPEWAAIKLPGVTGLRSQQGRKKQVHRSAG